MEEKDRIRIQNYVSLKSPEEIKGLLLGELFLCIVLPVMVLGMGYWLNVNVFRTAWVIFYFLYLALFIWDIYIIKHLYKQQVEYILFNSIMCLTCSAQFLASFYAFGKTVVGVAPLYLSLGLVIAVACIWIVFLYRIRTYKGLTKAKSGSPNYAVIILVALAGGGIVKLFFSNISGDMQYKLVTISLFVVGTGTAMAITSIHQYYIAKKHKDIIVLFAKPVSKNGKSKLKK